LPKHQLIGLPAVEIYQTARVNARLQLNVTDICLPVAGPLPDILLDFRGARNHSGGQEGRCGLGNH
jgi:hypothetical protein